MAQQAQTFCWPNQSAPLNVKVSWCTEWFVTIVLVESLVDLNSLFGRDQFTYIDPGCTFPVAVLKRGVQNDTERYEFRLVKHFFYACAPCLQAANIMAQVFFV